MANQQINDQWEQVNAFPQMARGPQNIPVAGPRGASAYEIAVAHGATMSETEWLASLVGPRGLKGDDGAGATDDQVAEAVAQFLTEHPPEPGKDGENVTQEELAATVAAFLRANPPEPGKNASDEQVAGAVAAFLSQSPPEKGNDGRDGATWLTGAGSPALNAKTGDLYLDTVTGDVWRMS